MPFAVFTFAPVATPGRESDKFSKGQKPVNAFTWPAIVLILLCFSLDSGGVRAATSGAVLAWGAGMGMHPDDFYDTKGQSVVPGIARSEVTAIAGGGVHTLALKTDGGVVAWGWNQDGQTDVPAAARSGVVAISAGGAHSVALKADGSVVAWGENSAGQTSVPAAATNRT